MITMTWKQTLCAFLLMASVAACAAPKIGYDYDHSANFSAYHTYEWMSGKQEATGDRRVDNSLVDIRIRTAVGAQLRIKGYATSVDGKPDFYVAYHVGVKDLTPNVSTQYYSDGMAGKAFTESADTRSAGSAHPTDSQAQSHIAGSLLVDIIDAASNKLVWRGTAGGEVDPGLTSEERDERIRTIVHEMMAHFPPK
jgi:uncharacterized protein DUF4136